MGEILAAFDNREKAILGWVALGLVCAMYSKDVRSSLSGILGILFSPRILCVFAATVAYIALIVFVSRWLELWNFSLLKGTLYWFFGAALVMLVNQDQAQKNPDYFGSVLLANVKLLLVLEFVINFYVLHIALEFALVPFMFIVGGMLAISETKAECASASRPLQFITASTGFLLLTYAAVKLVGNLESFATLDNLQAFALPIALTLSFLPFIYVVALYTAYETVFVRIGVFTKDSEVARYARSRVLCGCGVRLRLVSRLLTEYSARLSTIRSRADVTELLADLRAQQP